MLGAINKLLNPNQRKVNQVKPLVTKINAFEQEFVNRNDGQLLMYANELREKIREQLAEVAIVADNYRAHEQAILDAHLPDAFALVREVFRRVLGERSFDEQLMVGIFLHQGKAAEQKTGEGKTHAAVHPMFLNSLTGRGAHLVTVNDYLARRDAEWMGLIYSKLGATVGCVNSNNVTYMFDSEKAKALNPPDGNWRKFAFGHGDLLREASRREAYAADVTYGTNNEFGFDYLRDNMTNSLEAMVQVNANGEVGVHHYTIVDEVDSILIDEARTPLIISAPTEETNDSYIKFSSLVKRLNNDDYKLDEKAKNAFLTNLGVKKIEGWLGSENIYDNFEFAHHLEQALRAQFAYQKDIDYVVQDNQVKIVDEFTGRLMEGRRYSEGLHQALEAKEGVEIQKESKTVATVTFQNYFRLYEKLAGMSATILTEAEEFYKIYNLDSVSVPTHKSVARKDNPDRIYKNQRAKWKAIVDDIEEIRKNGQPVLVGTTSVENNELLSQLLKRRNVPHEVLNAKNHEREAEIVANAGQPGAVTVATNMAGRGTDIRLGVGVKEAGGLYVIGTERHEARRIDNQLRGRAGRQGDPGASRFYVAMDDNLMRIFGGERIASLMDRFNLPDDVPIENPMVGRSIEGAQQKVEGHNFDIRKHLVEYDDVINKQREIIYKRRRRLLEVGDEKTDTGEVSLESELVTKAEKIVSDWDAFETEFEKKKNLLTGRAFNDFLQYIFLTTIDQFWMDHIDALDELRMGIGLRGYGQREPLVEFKNEAYRMFERLIETIDYEIVTRFERIRIQTPEQIQARQQQPILEKVETVHQRVGQFDVPTQDRSQGVSGDEASLGVKQQTVVKSDELKSLSRNDPCPCGSGKKWKNCHWPNVP